MITRARREYGADADQLWWDADVGEVWTRVMDYVSTVEHAQCEIYDRFVKLAALYDPNGYNNSITSMQPANDAVGIRTENVVASNVDTVAATISTVDVRARFQTDDGGWAEQRQARQLELYSEGLATLLEVDQACRTAFKSAAIKGTGLVKVYIDAFDEIQVEHVMADDIIVDEVECRATKKPRQIHQRAYRDRELLKAEFPEHELEIQRAGVGDARTWRPWAGYRRRQRNEVTVLESWVLPIGRKGKRGYRPGRHTITIDSCDLLDEPYEKPHFPFARIVWTERDSGWYGISGAERIAGLQRALNKRNWQIDRQLDQGAVPTTYVRLADANMMTKTVNRIGTIVPYKSDIPKTVFPQAVSAETHQSRLDAKASAFEEFGQARMGAQGTKPAGLDSGEALREYKDQTSGRFATQEQGFEDLKLDVVMLVLGCCKELGAEAPIVSKRARFGNKKIKWSDVDLGDLRVKIAAASTLSRTPAGRMQTVLEWAQAGIISQDDARRLINHPDLESAMSLYTAAVEDIERCIEAIEDGHVITPEPYQNLKMGVWRMQMAYLRDRADGAPEDVLEGLRQWIDQAAYILSQQGQQVPGQVIQGGAGGDPAANGNAPPMPSSLPGGPPANGPAQSAFADQAMNLMAK